MKRFIFFACVYASLSFAIPFAAAGQDPDPYPNYVVIGAFAYHKNAIHFTEDANQHNFPARFEMNPNRNLYYVYVLTTDDRELAFAEALKLRADTKYFDTWVFSGPLGEAAITAGAEDQDLNPVTGEKISAVNTEQKATDATENIEQNTTGGPGRIKQKAVAESVKSQEKVTDTSANAGQKKTRRGGNTERTTTGEPDTSVNTKEKTAGGGTLNSAQNGTVAAKEAQIEDERLNGASQQNARARNDATGELTASPGNVALAKGESGQEENKASNKQESSGAAQPNGADKDKGKNQEQALSVSEGARVSGPTDRSNVNGPPLSSKDDKVDRTAPPRALPKKVSTAPLTSEEVVGKNLYFQLLRADNGEWVEGEVDAIDFERSRKMASYPANTPVKVLMPTGKSKQISFVCQVFGYRKQQIEFDPATPSPDFFLDENGNLIIPFELVRLQKGDIAIMYNVFFFKDAAVMRPESRYEVNNLLDLLKENPLYKIKIHGHTNGNAAGKIIRLDNTENFYSLSSTKQGFGSAKGLSQERALVIKQFLVSSGIPEERMQVKAWGGKKPIHDKHSVRAIENVRVEIEILSD